MIDLAISCRLFAYGLGIHLVQGHLPPRSSTIDPKAEHLSFQVRPGQQHLAGAAMGLPDFGLIRPLTCLRDNRASCTKKIVCLVVVSAPTGFRSAVDSYIVCWQLAGAVAPSSYGTYSSHALHSLRET